LGEPVEPYLDDDGGSVLLVCPACGCQGCWDFVARIECHEDRVLWHDFRQIHRREWSYASFGPFVFDIEPYERALASL
jgi:hypothetical protein